MKHVKSFCAHEREAYVYKGLDFCNGLCTPPSGQMKITFLNMNITSLDREITAFWPSEQPISSKFMNIVDTCKGYISSRKHIQCKHIQNDTPSNCLWCVAFILNTFYLSLRQIMPNQCFCLHGYMKFSFLNKSYNDNFNNLSLKECSIPYLRDVVNQKCSISCNNKQRTCTQVYKAKNHAFQNRKLNEIDSHTHSI